MGGISAADSPLFEKWGDVRLRAEKELDNSVHITMMKT